MNLWKAFGFFNHSLKLTVLSASGFTENAFRPWDYPENYGICSQLDRKSKRCFLLSSMCIFSESNETKS